MKRVLTIWLLVAVAVASALIYSVYRRQKIANISSFDECAAAGYLVMDSYPGQCRTPDGRLFVQNIGNELEYIDEIMISNPRPNQKITSPLNIVGQARGPWYFEASFMAQILDSRGQILGEAIVTAEGEWMTENFVPYTATLNFSDPTTSEGKLILHNANPSGLPENAKQLIIPVKF